MTSGKIKTIEELEALPFGAIVRTCGTTVYQKRSTWWARPGETVAFATTSIWSGLPVDLLWLP